MSTGEGKTKKSKKAKDKLSLPENYIQDKAKMATETLNRMNKSKILYGDLLKLVNKQYIASQELCSIGEQVSEILSKLGSLHPGDLGLVLCDMASYSSEIDVSMKNWSSSLYNEFVVPIAKSMDPHLKEISDKTKEVKTQTSLLVKQMTVVEKEVQRAGKIGQNQLVEAMQEFNQKKDETDKKKAEILLDVLLMERQRYIFLIEHYLKTLQAQIFLGKHMEAMTKDMQSWRDICYTKNALSEEQIIALTTASEQTFKQVGNSSDQENAVFLYKSTSLGLKNLVVADPIEGQEKETMRRVKSSNYVSRSNQKNSTWLDSIISPRETEEVDVRDVPVGFPPAPEIVSEKFEGSDREGYKVWMRKKVDYEFWVNSLRAYRKREREGNGAACRKIIETTMDQLSHPVSHPIPSSQTSPRSSPGIYLEVSTPSVPNPYLGVSTPTTPNPYLGMSTPTTPIPYITLSTPQPVTSPYSPPLQPTEPDMYNQNLDTQTQPTYLMSGLVPMQPQFQEENGENW